jgi:hypothetical protein
VPATPEKRGASIEAVDVGKEDQEENQPKIAASTVKAQAASPGRKRGPASYPAARSLRANQSLIDMGGCGTTWDRDFHLSF